MVSVHMEVPMPVQLFTKAERAQRDRFPEAITYEDLVIFFTLSDRDHEVSDHGGQSVQCLGHSLRCSPRALDTSWPQTSPESLATRMVCSRPEKG